MARRWRYVAEMHWQDGAVSLYRTKIAPASTTPQAALSLLFAMLSAQTRTCRKAMVSIRAGKVTRTWETKK